jgi:hypothetical protein
MATMLRRSIGMSDLAVGSLSAGRATSIQENIAVFLGGCGTVYSSFNRVKGVIINYLNNS